MNVGVIPARLGSTRFPKKILEPIEGKPMIAYVVEQVQKSQLLDKVILAIDSEETRESLSSFDFEMVMTSNDHVSGTDRVVEVINVIDEAEIIINIQGDEPLIDPKIIDGLISTFNNPTVNIATVVSRKLTVSDLLNPNMVKVLLDEQSNCIDFKRDVFDLEIGGVYKHIGIYGYRRNSLFQFSMLKSTEREKSRSLEQLRLLDNGMKISAMISNCEQWAVDTKEDLEKVKQMMAATKTTIDEES